MIFRVLVFILLVLAGYQSSRKLRGDKISISLVSTLLVIILVGIFIMGRKLWAMFGFSMYLMLIVLGYAAGILAGLSNKKKQLPGQASLPVGEQKIKKTG